MIGLLFGVAIYLFCAFILLKIYNDKKIMSQSKHFFYYKSSDAYKDEVIISVIVSIVFFAALAITMLKEAVNIEVWPEDAWGVSGIIFGNDFTNLLFLANIVAIPTMGLTMAYAVNLIFYKKTVYSSKEDNELRAMGVVKDIITMIFKLSYVYCIAAKIKCAYCVVPNMSRDGCKTTECLMPHWTKMESENKCYLLTQSNSEYDSLVDSIALALEDLRYISLEHYLPLRPVHKHIIWDRKENSLSKIFCSRYIIEIFGNLFHYYRDDERFIKEIVNTLISTPVPSNSLLPCIAHTMAGLPRPSGPSRSEVVSHIYKVSKIASE